MDHRMYHSPLPLNCAKLIYAIFSYNTLKRNKHRCLHYIANAIYLAQVRYLKVW